MLFMLLKHYKTKIICVSFFLAVVWSIGGQLAFADGPVKILDLGTRNTSTTHHYNWILITPNFDMSNPQPPCITSGPGSTLGLITVDAQGAIRVCGSTGFRNAMEPWLRDTDGSSYSYIYPNDVLHKVSIGDTYHTNIDPANSGIKFKITQEQASGSYINSAEFKPADPQGNTGIDFYVNGTPLTTNLDHSLIYINFLLGASAAPWHGRIEFVESAVPSYPFTGLNFFSKRRAFTNPEYHPDLRLFGDGTGRIDFGSDSADPPTIRGVTSTHMVKVYGDTKADDLYLDDGSGPGKFNVIYVGPVGGTGDKYYASYGP